MCCFVVFKLVINKATNIFEKYHPIMHGIHSCQLKKFESPKELNKISTIEHFKNLTLQGGVPYFFCGCYSNTNKTLSLRFPLRWFCGRDLIVGRKRGHCCKPPFPFHNALQQLRKISQAGVAIRSIYGQKIFVKGCCHLKFTIDSLLCSTPI